mgnify:CR=1 FL=1
MDDGVTQSQQDNARAAEPARPMSLPENDEELLNLLEQELQSAHEESERVREEITERRGDFFGRLFGTLAV